MKRERIDPVISLIVFFFVLFFFFPREGYALDSRFSVSYNVGVYKPSLRSLNKILGDPSRAILQDPNYLLPRNRLLPAEKRNIVSSPMAGKTTYGLEVQWEASKKFSLVGTISVWSGESKASDQIDLFLRQDLPPGTFPRNATYDLKVSQIWLGWKYNLYQDPDQGRLFLNFGLFGLSISDLTLDSVVKVNSPEAGLNFASVSSTEAQGTAFTSRFGIGGEIFLTESISFGVNANYIIAETSKVKVKRHFRASFSLDPDPPPETTDLLNVPQVPEEGDSLTTATVVSENITDRCTPGDDQGGCGREAGDPLKLELNGFHFTAVIRYYF